MTSIVPVAAALRVATLILAAGLLAACAAGPAVSSGPGEGESGSSPSADVQLVEAVADAALGTYLVGRDGRTLYVYAQDAPGTSACVDECATAWPPFTLDAGGSVAGGAGVDGTFGTVTRADGSRQVTYAGAPLYYFSGDTLRGDANGQGLGGAWSVAPATGGSTGTQAPRDYGY